MLHYLILLAVLGEHAVKCEAEKLCLVVDVPEQKYNQTTGKRDAQLAIPFYVFSSMGQPHVWVWKQPMPYPLSALLGMQIWTPRMSSATNNAWESSLEGRTLRYMPIFRLVPSSISGLAWLPAALPSPDIKGRVK